MKAELAFNNTEPLGHRIRLEDVICVKLLGIAFTILLGGLVQPLLEQVALYSDGFVVTGKVYGFPELSNLQNVPLFLSQFTVPEHPVAVNVELQLGALGVVRVIVGTVL